MPVHFLKFSLPKNKIKVVLGPINADQKKACIEIQLSWRQMWVEFVFGIVLWFDFRGFLGGFSGFPSPPNQHFEVSIRPGMVDEEQQIGCATSKTLFTQLPD